MNLQKERSQPKFLQYAELYSSLQGEGMHSGLPCFFIRTAICDIRCKWCDTPYALTKGLWISLDELLSQIPTHISLVQITGGEPLVQKKNIITLIEILTSTPYNKKVLLETGGHRSLNGLPKQVHIVMDIKLPSSGEENYDFAANFPYLKPHDEIKFVIQDLEDFKTAEKWISKYDLQNKCNLLFSPVWEQLPLADLAQWILEAKLDVRMQAQIHKVIWPKKDRGV